MNLKRKEVVTMRIAATYSNGEVFQHFGRTEQFKIYDVQDGKMISEQIVNVNGSGHGALAGFLKQKQVEILICGGIGMGAKNALEDAQIRLYSGVQGSADDAVKALLTDSLVYEPESICDHHDTGGVCSHSGNDHHCNEDKHGCPGNGSYCRD